MRAAGSPLRERLRAGASFAFVLVGVALAWEVVKAPVVDRSPPAVAVRLAPTSQEVLRRAAEAELAGKRVANARALADESLARAPFNARALRVRGLSEAELGSEDLADEILTLAGNWSLRDDQAHGWLVQHRLKRGDYSSAFAHADTLARRRSELLPPTMNLFSTAGLADPRAAAALIRLLATNPPWRSAYLADLQSRRDGDPLLTTIVLGLQTTRAPLTLEELKAVYAGWVAESRFPAVALVRQRLNRPPAEQRVINAGFATPVDEQLTPFGWTLGSGSGVSVEITEDDSGNGALLVNYDGYGGAAVARQLLTLQPGPWRVSGRWRMDTAGDPRLRWTLSCVTGQLLATHPVEAAVPGGPWGAFVFQVVVPSGTCPAQQLTLTPFPGDRRTTITAWFDDLKVDPAALGSRNRQDR